ncbi:hypothetical protein Pcaca05_20220 [Pectobacterium carotovorum subsp. carotovorum]|nr:hypothetical protein Pcaca05_20220 [Pectobacterium carotovorum subsp. carotovorum]
MNKILFITTLLFYTGASYAIPPQFSSQPSFEDNFHANNLDETKWIYRYLGKRNFCINDKSAVYIQNNILKITTYTTKNEKGEMNNYCGMIATDGKFKQQYGYWEASIRFNSIQGVQPAFWIQSATIGEDISNPEKSGVEIDVFEHLAEAKINEYDNAIHWNGYGDAHKYWSKKYTGANINDGKFHTFSVAWTPTGYTFYLDNKEVEHVSTKAAPISTAEQYIILSTEVPRKNYPSSGFGNINESKATLEIKYVKVYPLKK